MWVGWRPVFGWATLCPVVGADSLGLVRVMLRAIQPVTFEDVQRALNTDDWPDIDVEASAENFGQLDGTVLALDYGVGCGAGQAATRLL